MIVSYYSKIKFLIKKYKFQPIVDVAIFGIITVFFHYIWWHGLKEFLLNFMAFQQTEAFLAHQVFLPSAWIVEHILSYPITTADNTLFFEKYRVCCCIGFLFWTKTVLSVVSTNAFVSRTMA